MVEWIYTVSSRFEKDETVQELLSGLTRQSRSESLRVALHQTLPQFLPPHVGGANQDDGALTVRLRVIEGHLLICEHFIAVTLWKTRISSGDKLLQEVPR